MFPERISGRALLAAAGAIVVTMAAVATPVLAAEHPSEAALRQAFEGKYVKVKLDMPASARGVDVWPANSPALDYPDLAKRIKDAGIGVKKGEEIMVTKVHVKPDLIEFQLGGGGFGTFSDALASSAPPASYSGESKYEKDLKNEIKATSDPDKRRELQRELDKAKSERERDNARNQTEALEAQQTAKAAAREKAASAGSRFNIRYKGGLPGEILSPDGVKSALAAYVELVDGEGGEDGGSAEVSDASAPARPGGSTADLKKGMTREQVEAILGPAEEVSSKDQDGTKVVNATYRTKGRVVQAVFVEGVLARYSIESD